jgi:hypothetical protein
VPQMRTVMTPGHPGWDAFLAELTETPCGETLDHAELILGRAPSVVVDTSHRDAPFEGRSYMKIVSVECPWEGYRLNQLKGRGHPAPPFFVQTLCPPPVFTEGHLPPWKTSGTSR